MMTHLLHVAAGLLGDAEGLGIPNSKNTDVQLGEILNKVYVVAAIVAVIMIIIAGFLYITADGDSNKVSSAKNAIIYSLVGLVVVAFAFAITNFITKGI